MAEEFKSHQDTELAEAIAVGMPACPNCNGRNVRVSILNGLRDTLMALANYSPFRCRVCQHRFYKRAPRYYEPAEEEPTTDPSNTERPAGG